MQSLSEFKFYQRLQSEIKAAEEAKRPEHAALQRFSGSIQPVVDAAEHISERVCSSLPQFTLHDKNHLWNVLGLMERLAGDDTIAKMSALECGIAILAAFTHDLGMALSAEELDTLTDPSEDEPVAKPSPAAVAWRTYFDGHALSERIREARSIAATEGRRLTEDEVEHLNRALGQIRSDYVRESHAREEGSPQLNRIEEWLHKIEQSLKLEISFEGTDLSRHIALLAMSHGQSIFWLGERLTRRPKPLLEREELVRAHRIKGQEVNWSFLGWLLRLADVMDFDASRTPAVLFDHIGIRDGTSRIEWQKHLSISEPPRFGQGPDQSTLIYVCEVCPHPRIEKAIKDMLGWINAELASVRGELQRHPPARGMSIQLPSRADVDIQTRQDGYLYQDLEFQLRREAILELLMGESLYGDPCLALRELVQNALDAVHLRDLRNQLWAKLPAGKKPADMPEPHQPWDNGEDPKVWVTWGQEAGRNFIRVKDNGVGMSLGAIRRFLTQIGKSYYKSDSYRRERELMRQHGLICTPISQFGIGFLSVFMLADKVTIRTRPAGTQVSFPPDQRTEAEKEAMRFPLRAEIDGPHGLIAIYPEDDCSETGTEVTLWLKHEHQLASWDLEQTLRWLRQIHYEKDELNAEEEVDAHKQNQAIHPAFEIGRRIVWPLYPIIAAPAGETSTLQLDGLLHFRDLQPISAQKLQDKAQEWGFDSKQLNQVTWQCCDWVDDGAEGTGSRVRLTLPSVDGAVRPIVGPEGWKQLAARLHTPSPAQEDLQTLVQPQLGSVGNQQRLLINGVWVPDVKSVWQWQEIMVGLGACLWIDLRGPAAPKLTANRRSSTKQQGDDVSTNVKRVLRQWFLHMAGDESVPRWLAAAVHHPKAWPVPQAEPADAVKILRPLWRIIQLISEQAFVSCMDSAMPRP